MFQKWKVYCRENKTKTIPKAESKLSGWVHDQRKAWRKLLNKQKTTMTTERVQLLSLAGFIFDPTTTTAEISTPKMIGKNTKAATPKSTPKAKAVSKSSDQKVPSKKKPTPKSTLKPEKMAPEHEKKTTPKSSDQKVPSKKKPTPKSTLKPEKKTPENEKNPLQRHQTKRYPQRRSLLQSPHQQQKQHQ
jgi:hypothetical protein